MIVVVVVLFFDSEEQVEHKENESLHVHAKSNKKEDKRRILAFLWLTYFLIVKNKLSIKKMNLSMYMPNQIKKRTKDEF